ncbi:MAG TPA: hypothetical protein VGQ37_14045 [Vicinamibacterales bacterium]|jgi:hypothetical protein|nr:hypothetical protein [Vicinamibacterales bacterium]
MRFRLLSLLVAAAVFAGTAACDEALSDLTGPTPNLQPTFSSIQKEIFDTTDSSGRLACVNCHTAVGRVPSAGLDLTAGNSYSRLVGVSSVERPGVLRVAAGDPDNSYIVHKLEGRSDIVGGRMPRGTGPFLTSGQMLVIRRWIADGAANN